MQYEFMQQYIQTALSHINKIKLDISCYFCDMNYYELYEESMTGMRYININDIPYPTYIQNKNIRYSINNRKTRNEITYNKLDVINNVIQKLENMNQKQILKYVSDDKPVAITNNYEEINYEAVFYRSPEYEIRIYPPGLD